MRAVWDRWNRGDRTIEPQLLDSDLEVHSALTGQTYRGAEGLRRWSSEIDDQFKHWEVSVDETHVLRQGLLLVHGRICARGRGSGMHLDEMASWLVDMADGRITRIRNFIGSDAATVAAAEGESA